MPGPRAAIRGDCASAEGGKSKNQQTVFQNVLIILIDKRAGCAKRLYLIWVAQS
jgi:hypothetical protein